MQPTTTPEPRFAPTGEAGQTVVADSATVSPMTTAKHAAPTGTTANWTGVAFYIAVAAVALAGQSLAAVHWLHWPLYTAVAAVAVVELGGIALAARADYRRRLGENAYAARILSAAVAVGAVAINWLGHDSHLAGGFFAFMSALGYAVWLINSGDRRRDQLRADNKLPPTAPAYEIWNHWIRQPLVTARARSMAKECPALGLYGSLTAAQVAIRTECREAALAAILHRKLAAGRDGVAADLAVATYDLTEIARRIADRADYDLLTDLIAAEIAPERLVSAATQTAEGSDMATDIGAASMAGVSAPESGSDLPEPADTCPAHSAAGTDRPGGHGAAMTADTARPFERPPARPSDRSSKASDTATKVAKLVDKYPDIDAATVAAKLPISERTARRHLSVIRPDKPAVTTRPFDPAVDGHGAGHDEPMNGRRSDLAGVSP